MHSNGKGISASALPFRRTQPSWSKATPEDVSDQIFKFAKRGLSPSQIGVILRDSHGIPQVKFVTGNKILRILKTNGGFLFSEGVSGKGEHQQGTEFGSAGRLEPWIVFTGHSSRLVLDVQEAMLVKGMRGRAGENSY
jgi:hypothetical protein